MYCPECGHKINEGAALFCPECGTKLQEIVDTPSATADDSGCRDASDATTHGLILTNSKYLAEKLNKDTRSILESISWFIEEKKRYGVIYKLVDVDNYSYRSSNLFGIAKTKKLTPRDDVQRYIEIIREAQEDEIRNRESLSRFIFIIGGNDIIPVPYIKNYVSDSDEFIDTDLPYAYTNIKGDIMPMFESQEIFRHDAQSYVGRLPIGEDTTYDDLCNYLVKAADNSYGIPLTLAYGQTDPNWKNVSATVSIGLFEQGLLTSAYDEMPRDCHFRRLITSPRITFPTTSQIFTPQASLYYFNLHGCDELEYRGYYGKTTNQTQCLPVLMPENLQECASANIIISEACYGARFIGKDRYHSMLLAALYTNTLSFIGSSATAWGNIDKQGVTEYTPHRPNYADIIAHASMEMLQQGYPAGIAFYIARNEMLRRCEGYLDPYTALTFVEFNLYGDPTILFATPHSHEKNKKAIDHKKYFAPATRGEYTVENLTDKTASGNESILQQVRNEVDNSIAQIQNKINTHLYTHYGIEPRKATSIYRINFADGGKKLRFNYETPSFSKRSGTIAVTTDDCGQITEIISTK